MKFENPEDDVVEILLAILLTDRFAVLLLRAKGNNACCIMQYQ